MKTITNSRKLARLHPLCLTIATAAIITIGILPVTGRAASGTWLLNPINGDWNTGSNWSSGTPPNGPFDTATFGVSNQTEVSLSASVGIFEVAFSNGANNYSIKCSPGIFLSLGSGVRNESGTLQSFVATVDNAGNHGLFAINESSSLGELTAFTNEGAIVSGAAGGDLQFIDSPHAGSATLVNEGGAVGGASGGTIEFFNSASADNATITNQAGEVAGALGGMTQFWFVSRAATSTITSEGGSVTDAAGGVTLFRDNSSAGNATLIANGGSNGGGGGSIQFQGKAGGATARIEVFGNGNLDLTLHNPGIITIGSLEGDGQVLLGSHSLSIGANNLSTVFSGVIQDNGGLTKTGSGTLTLSGANVYTGGTSVTSGALKVANRTGSATGTGTVSVNAGTLGGRGIIAGPTTIGTGSGAGAFLEPSVGARQPATTTIQSLLTFKADGSYTYKLNTKKARADEVVANGVTIESGAQFNFSAIGNKRLPLGSVFVALSNTSASPISGAFANLADGYTLSAGKNKYQASYTGGDGNELTLTVVP